MLESDFLKAIEADPCDPTPRFVYADWLDDQGDPRGELLRIQEELRHLHVSQRAQKESRMHELLCEGVEPLTITQMNSLGMEIVLIIPGEFMTGSPEDEEDRCRNENQVEVVLTQPFFIGKCVVTQSEWIQLMDSQPWERQDFIQEGDRYPATYVSWEDAQNFCEKLTYQEQGFLLPGWRCTLPTEAQWEYSCRAGTTTRFSFGKHESALTNYGWYEDNAYKLGEDYPHEVCQKLPNGFGLYDMHGNGWEWCQDWYQMKLPGGIDPEVKKKTTKAAGRVYRGGNWHNSGWYCRCACRSHLRPRIRGWDVGFRLAYSPFRN